MRRQICRFKKGFKAQLDKIPAITLHPGMFFFLPLSPFLLFVPVVLHLLFAPS